MSFKIWSQWTDSRRFSALAERCRKKWRQDTQLRTFCMILFFWNPICPFAKGTYFRCQDVVCKKCKRKLQQFVSCLRKMFPSPIDELGIVRDAPAWIFVSRGIACGSTMKPAWIIYDSVRKQPWCRQAAVLWREKLEDHLDRRNWRSPFGTIKNEHEYKRSITKLSTIASIGENLWI
jgi:hypothetical protein